MDRTLDLQIRDHITEYVSGRMSLHQFLDWFMDAAEDAEDIGDPALLDLVDSIKLYWAEFTNGDRSEDDLRALWRTLVDTYKVQVQTPGMPAMPNIVTSTTADRVSPETRLYFSPDSQPHPMLVIIQPGAQETFRADVLCSHCDALSVVDKPQWNTTQELVLK